MSRSKILKGDGLQTMESKFLDEGVLVTVSKESRGVSIRDGEK